MTDLNGVDVTVDTITQQNVADAGLYLFYAVLLGIGGLAGLIVIAVVLLSLLKKAGIKAKF